MEDESMIASILINICLIILAIIAGLFRAWLIVLIIIGLGFLINLFWYGLIAKLDEIDAIEESLKPVILKCPCCGHSWEVLKGCPDEFFRCIKCGSIGKNKGGY